MKKRFFLKYIPETKTAMLHAIICLPILCKLGIFEIEHKNIFGGSHMKTITQLGIGKFDNPIKVLQFGEGNFLRAFADYMIDVANENGLFNGNIVIVKPRQHGSLASFQTQDSLYTVNLRGKEKGETVDCARIIRSVDRAVNLYDDPQAFPALAGLETLKVVISNTTEAGITLQENDRPDSMPESFPGKLTKFLYARYTAFSGAPDKGLIVLPTELIENNGQRLKACVMEMSKIWGLPAAFADWVDSACVFCSTLVDRIVTGFPTEKAEELYEKLGYTDALLDVAEPFALWVIESPRDIQADFPLDKAGMPVVFTRDLTPYRERKVRILNGAHTATVLLGWLSGLDTVGQCMEDPDIRAFMEKALSREIVPFVKLAPEEVRAFSNAVFERFENPFLYHRLLDISLNSVSKWKARVLPSFRDYYAAHGKLPRALTLSFAALLTFYSGKDSVIQRAKGDTFAVRDGQSVLDCFREHSAKPTLEYVTAIAQNQALWGQDLTQYPGFVDFVAAQCDLLRRDVRSVVQTVWEENV